MKSDVFLSRLKTGGDRLACFRHLLDRIDHLLSDYKRDDFVGIKMTIGDEHNKVYIKPELVRVLVDHLKDRGCRPFVFDTNVIYTGKRQNAVDHLTLAYKKGFTPGNIGCPYIIADGVFGTDSRIRKVDFKNMREIRVPSLIGILQDLIVMSHITGHIMSGYAASVKNVAMGMASRAGKQVQHSSVKPVIKGKKCTLCGCCMALCPVSAISEKSGKASIHSRTCIGCGECISACKFDAVKINWREDTNLFAERMAEYAKGILDQINKKVFINFALDVTEECDCISGDDPTIASDAGILASEDILAVDKACFDMLAGREDVFSRQGTIQTHLHQFRYAEEIGVGSLDYTLLEE